MALSLPPMGMDPLPPPPMAPTTSLADVITRLDELSARIDALESAAPPTDLGAPPSPPLDLGGVGGMPPPPPPPM
jgi:hypothetical protein